MNRYERKMYSKERDVRRFLRHSLMGGSRFRSLMDYEAHPEAHPHYFHRHRNIWKYNYAYGGSGWKTQQKHMANKRLRQLYSHGFGFDMAALPLRSEYKKGKNIG